MSARAVLSIVLFASLLLLFPEPGLGSLPQLVGPHGFEYWLPTIHTPTNAYYLSIPDPLASILGQVLAIRLHGLIFFLGLSVALRVNALASAAATLVLLRWFGADQLVLPAISFVPWLAYSFNKPYLLISSFSLLLSIYAQAQALLGVAFAAVLCSTRSGSFSVKRLACAALPALLVMAITPSLPFPDYPPAAHVVPDDGVPGIIRPLIGADLPIPSINRQAVKSALGAPVQAILFLSAALVLFRFGAGRLLTVGILFVIACFVDIRLPENISQIGPVAALSRLVPNLFLVPSIMVWMAITITILFAVMAEELPLRPKAKNFFIALSGLYLWWAYGHAIVPREAQSPPSKVEASPSLYILQVYGPEILQRQSTVEKAKFVPLKRDGINITSNPPGSAGELQLLADRRGNGRRWSPHHAQGGDEWLHLELPQEQELDGIEIDPGAFASDFPRGLQIAVSLQCGERDFSGYEVILNLPDWQGPIQFSPNGFPYFGSQSDVRLFFPRTVKARCILIKQTGKEPRFDWSVSEIRLLPAVEKGTAPEASPF